MAAAQLSEREKKKMHEKHEKILEEMMNDEANKFCADCGQKGTRWASWNIGCFLCIRCGGIHRKLGTHITKIKSITLDTWTPEQIQSIQEKGNTKVNAIYNPNPAAHPVPKSDIELEQFIRDKYERKLFADRNAVPAQSSTVAAPAQVEDSRYANQINVLRDMGFTNTSACIAALTKFNGNVQSTVEYLIAHPSASTAQAPAAQQIVDNVSNEEKSAISQLKSMGFNDEKTVLSVLRKYSGNVGDTASYLAAKGKGVLQNSPRKLDNITKPVQQQQKPVDDLLSLDFSSPVTQQTSNASNPFGGNDLFGAPQPQSSTLFATNNNVGGFDAFASAPAPKNDKNAILSLYSNTPAASNPFAATQNPFGNMNSVNNQPFQSAPNAFASPATANAASSFNQNSSYPFGNPAPNAASSFNQTSTFNALNTSNQGQSNQLFSNPASTNAFSNMNNSLFNSAASQNSSFGQPAAANPFQQGNSLFSGGVGAQQPSDPFASLQTNNTAMPGFQANNPFSKPNNNQNSYIATGSIAPVNSNLAAPRAASNQQQPDPFGGLGMAKNDPFSALNPIQGSSNTSKPATNNNNNNNPFF